MIGAHLGINMKRNLPTSKAKVPIVDTSITPVVDAWDD